MKRPDKSTTTDSPTKDHARKDRMNDAVKSTLMFSEHIRVTTTVVFTSLGCIALFGGGGYLLDQQLGSYPALMIIGILISFPFSQYIIYRWVKKSYTPSLVEKSRSQDHEE